MQHWVQCCSQASLNFSAFSLKSPISFINNNLFPPAWHLLTCKYFQHRPQEPRKRDGTPHPLTSAFSALPKSSS